MRNINGTTTTTHENFVQKCIFSQQFLTTQELRIEKTNTGHPDVSILSCEKNKYAIPKSSWTRCALCHAKHLDMSIEWSESEIGMQIAMHNRESS